MDGNGQYLPCLRWAQWAALGCITPSARTKPWRTAHALWQSKLPACISFNAVTSRRPTETLFKADLIKLCGSCLVRSKRRTAILMNM